MARAGTKKAATSDLVSELVSLQYCSFVNRSNAGVCLYVGPRGRAAISSFQNVS